MKIFKYPVIFGCEPHKFIRPLHVGVQDGKIYIWALHDEKLNMPWEIWVQVTGAEFRASEAEHYIGTAQIGVFVYHIFARELEPQ